MTDSVLLAWMANQQARVMQQCRTESPRPRRRLKAQDEWYGASAEGRQRMGSEAFRRMRFIVRSDSAN